MSIDNIGDMKECGHAEYRRIYDKYKEKLTVFSSYSGGILGMPQMSTAWGIKGMETALIASECENWEHRREDPEAWTYWKNADLVAALDRAESAESSLAAMRQRAEEAEEKVLFWKGESESLRLQKNSYAGSLKALRFERDAAIARAERAESDAGHFCAEAVRAENALRGILDDLVEYQTNAEIENSIRARCLSVLSDTPPADASTMGGERCDTCPYDPETCDRAECPAWGKSEEAKARILASEANRPLNDEEHAIVDAGYERGKRILSEVKAEERERRLTDLLAHMTDAYELAYGEDCPLAKQARAALADMEQKS